MALITKPKLVALLVIGFVLIILGAVLGFGVFPSLVDDTVDKNVRLEFDTPQYERFKALPFPLSFKVYLFNVTNVEDVRENGTMPIVEEVGPYVYDEYLEKRNIFYNIIKNTIEYEQYRTFHFNQEASGNLTEKDVLTFINIPMVALQQMIVEILTVNQNPQLIPFIEDAIKLIFNKQIDPFLKATVKDYLWEGIKICEKSIMGAAPNDPKQVAEMSCRYMQYYGPKNVEHLEKYSMFAFLKYKNNTHDGRFVIDSGMESIEKVGQILQWQGMKYTKVWNPENETLCDKVHGLDATVYPPRVDNSSTFDIYATDICRTSKLRYVGDVEYEGIEGMRYEVSENEFASVDTEAANSCYCINGTVGLNEEPTECLPDGFVDMLHCQLAPVIASFPHMLWADDEYYNSTRGQSRDVEKHINFVELEPKTGSPLRGSKKIQFNMFLRSIEEIPITSGMFVNTSLIPLMWVDEGMELPPFLVDEIKHSFSTIAALDVITWLLIALGIVFVVCSLVGLWYLNKQAATML